MAPPSPAGAPEPLPWWPHLPPEQQQRLRRRLRRQRLLTWLRRRDVGIGLAVGSYVLFCLILLVRVHPLLAGFALLPLLLLPPVGYLAYWLMWQEFHR